MNNLLLKLLSDLQIGEKARIQSFHEESRTALRLQEMGLLPGTEIEMIRKASTTGPIEIKARGIRLTLRLEDAALINVAND